MLRQLLLLPLVAVSSTASAAIFMSDFTNNNGGFDLLNNTNVAVTGDNGDELTFESSNGQGGGVVIDPAEVLGGSITHSSVDSLFFDFTVRAPAISSGATDDLGIFFGAPSDNASSSSVTNGGNVNGFTFFFDDLELFARVGSMNVLLLDNLMVGQAVNFQVEFVTLGAGDGDLTLNGTTVPDAQNGGQFNTASIVTVSTVDGSQTSGELLLAGAMNQNANSIDAFTFNGTATRSDSGIFTSFTVSDQPIPVPEPSSAALIFLAGSALLLRRKRA